MGNFLSKDRGKAGYYEKVLTSIQEDIKSRQQSIQKLKNLNRSFQVHLVLFSSIFYSSYSVYLFLQRKLFKSSITTSTPTTLIFLFLFPPAIYYLKKLVNYLFNCRIAQKQDRLKARQAELKERLEEIKVETRYYQTKDLIEKYDEKNKKEESSSSKEKSIDNLKSTSMNTNKIPTTNTNTNTNTSTNTNTNTLKRRIPDQRLLPPSNSQASPHIHTNAQTLTPPYKSPNWMDRFMDALIGDDSRNQKYALICAQCFNHNGLAAPEQFDSVLKYRCPNCGFFNQQRIASNKMSSNDSDEIAKGNNNTSNNNSSSSSSSSSVQIKEEDTPIKSQNSPPATE